MSFQLSPSRSSPLPLPPIFNRRAVSNRNSTVLRVCTALPRRSFPLRTHPTFDILVSLYHTLVRFFSCFILFVYHPYRSPTHTSTALEARVRKSPGCSNGGEAITLRRTSDRACILVGYKLLDTPGRDRFKIELKRRLARNGSAGAVERLVQLDHFDQLTVGERLLYSR